MIILNFTACSNKNSIEASYIKIDNKNLLFGDKKSKNKFQFTEKENGHISKNLIIYFNNDDFKSESMDLCRKTGEYDLLKNVKEDSNGNKYPTFEKNKIDCHSFVHINKFNNNEYNVFYSLQFLDGFKIEQFKGFALYLSDVKTIKNSSNLKYNEEFKVFTYDNRELFLFIGENTK